MALCQIITLLLPIKGNPKEFCNYYITKLKYIHVHIDCDSQYFLLDSQHPGRLINGNTPLQDRPLFTYIVFLFSKLLNFIGIPNGPITYLGKDSIPQTYFLLNYALYVALNALILSISIYLIWKVYFYRVSSSDGFQKVFFYLSIFLVSQNLLTRVYFWTPHTQIFNLLVPCLLFLLVQDSFLVTKKVMIILNFFLITTSMMYPLVFVILPLVFLKTKRNLGIRSAASYLLTFLPYLLWPKIVDLSGGHYRNWLTEAHRRFLWIFDSYGHGTLWHDMLTNLGQFLNSFPPVLTLVSVFLVISYFILRKNREHQTSLGKSFDLKMGILAFAPYGIVVLTQGEYGERFTTGLVLLLVLVALREVAKFRIKKVYLNLGVGLVILLNVASILVG